MVVVKLRDSTIIACKLYLSQEHADDIERTIKKANRMNINVVNDNREFRKIIHDAGLKIPGEVHVKG